MTITTIKTDQIGVIASVLCMIHCIATPFVFFARACSTSCCADAPYWWSLLDFVFLVVSFFAIYQTRKRPTKKWLKIEMWTSWSLLFAVLVIEKLNLFTLFDYAIYIPAFALVFLHLQNLKHCPCKPGSCIVN